MNNHFNFTNQQGSAVFDEDGVKVFDATYDAWGRQTVTRNTIGLSRGYTGHEMMGEYGLVNMNRRSLARSGESNGRLYDSTLSRFLSPDNYVQEPDNSQSFNRYSYCLNNPLKYTDPSGELSGIDDLTLAIVGLGVVNSMIHAAYSGTNIWKAEAQSLFLAAANYATCDLWQAFGEVNGVGHELLRAGAHGLFNATLSALESGDFLKGALNGFQIGLLNHAMHGGNNKKMMGKPGICVLLPDRTYAAPYDLDEFGTKCTSCAKKTTLKFGGFAKSVYLCTRNSEIKQSSTSGEQQGHASLAQLVEQLTLNQWV